MAEELDVFLYLLGDAGSIGLCVEEFKIVVCDDHVDGPENSFLVLDAEHVLLALDVFQLELLLDSFRSRTFGGDTALLL